MQPWRLLADPSGAHLRLALRLSGGLGAIAGVLIADYWILRRRTLLLADLYLVEGAYTYRRGWNWRGRGCHAAGLRAGVGRVGV